MIHTCSELPKCLFNKENELNDYDFVLYHQYLKDSDYRLHYLEQRKIPNRIMILDNSAYEFFVSGEQFIEDDYIKVIYELQPDYYIVPDVLMDNIKTLENFLHWIKITISISKDIKSRPYFVPQGKTLDEFFRCIFDMKTYIDIYNLPKNICIPFHNDFFRDRPMVDVEDSIIEIFGKPYNELTDDEHYAAGRISLMKFLLVYIDPDYHDYTFHMLGSHCPKEIKYYTKFPQIKTIDSGYPVKLAIEGKALGTETEKPNIIIDDFFNKKLTNEEKDLIILNIYRMKEYRNGRD